MARPRGEALEIAKTVIPALAASQPSSKKKRKKVHGAMSEVEIEQTRNIDRKEGLK